MEEYAIAGAMIISLVAVVISAVSVATAAYLIYRLKAVSDVIAPPSIKTKRQSKSNAAKEQDEEANRINRRIDEIFTLGVATEKDIEEFGETEGVVQ